MKKRHNIPKLINTPYSKNSKISSDQQKHEDKSLWLSIADKVQPLNTNKRISKPFVKTLPHKLINCEHTDNITGNTIDNNNYLLELPKIEPNLKRRIAKGLEPIGATLDLHGMLSEEAYQELLHFIKRLNKSNIRTALIITGKGKSGEGIIRKSLPNWLSTSSINHIVQSYSPASQPHGGEGAFYIRLCKTF